MFFTPELARRAAERHTLSMRLASALRTRVARTSLIALVALFAALSVARADELKLKDGTTVVGTIVGFEEHSFKVKTSYGFAEVQRDQVVSIVISPVAKKKELEKKPDPSADAAVAPDPAPTKVTKPAPAKPVTPPANNSAGSPSSVASRPQTRRTPRPVLRISPRRTLRRLAPAVANSPAVPPPVAPTPAPRTHARRSERKHLRERHLQLPHVQAASLGIDRGSAPRFCPIHYGDGHSRSDYYLLIGQQPVSKSVANDMDATERVFKKSWRIFRPLDEKHITISGLPAIERHFRGRVDQRDWSGVVYVSLATRASTQFFGMTVADTDLVQIQENVIARAISSLQFTK